jgi:hypothetical protein
MSEKTINWEGKEIKLVQSINRIDGYIDCIHYAYIEYKKHFVKTPVLTKKARYEMTLYGCNNFRFRKVFPKNTVGTPEEIILAYLSYECVNKGHLYYDYVRAEEEVK